MLFVPFVTIVIIWLCCVVSSSIGKGETKTAAPKNPHEAWYTPHAIRVPYEITNVYDAIGVHMV